MRDPVPAPEVPRLGYRVLERRGPQDRLLVLCHGYGLPVSDLTDRLGLLDPNGRFLVVTPTAPFRHRDQVIWHKPTMSTDAAAQYMASLAALDDLLGHLGTTTGRAAADAVIGGFSQGGSLGLSLLLHADVVNRPAAAFGIHSFPAHVEGFRVQRAAAAGRPAFLSGARNDRFAPVDMYRAGASLFRSVGLALTYREHDGDHDMSDEAAVELGEWLASLGEPGPATEPDPDASGWSGPSPFQDLWKIL